MYYSVLDYVSSYTAQHWSIVWCLVYTPLCSIAPVWKNWLCAKTFISFVLSKPPCIDTGYANLQLLHLWTDLSDFLIFETLKFWFFFNFLSTKSFFYLPSALFFLVTHSTNRSPLCHIWYSFVDQSQVSWGSRDQLWPISARAGGILTNQRSSRLAIPQQADHPPKSKSPILGSALAPSRVGPTHLCFAWLGGETLVGSYATTLRCFTCYKCTMPQHRGPSNVSWGLTAEITWVEIFVPNFIYAYTQA